MLDKKQVVKIDVCDVMRLPKIHERFKKAVKGICSSCRKIKCASRSKGSCPSNCFGYDNRTNEQVLQDRKIRSDKYNKAFGVMKVKWEESDKTREEEHKSAVRVVKGVRWSKGEVVSLTLREFEAEMYYSNSAGFDRGLRKASRIVLDEAAHAFCRGDIDRANDLRSLSSIIELKG